MSAIHKEAWYLELEKGAREMSLPYDPSKEPGGALDEEGEGEGEDSGIPLPAPVGETLIPAL